MLEAVLLDPSINSQNIGDSIIRESVTYHLDTIMRINQSLPTQTRMTLRQASIAARHQLAIVGGTNLLSSNMPWYRQWKLDRRSRTALKGKVVLMGVGWWQYQKSPNAYTRAMLRSVLSDEWTHSVRDNYTKHKLTDLGLQVVNTACPTMWGLKKIAPSQHTPDSCVVTLTNYNRDRSEDQWLIDEATKYYKNVVVWPQSVHDATYAKELKGKFKILSPTLNAYQTFLDSQSVDYVGTRLHGGVRAFQSNQWGVIVAVDNRAIEIGRDTGLPVFQRGDRAVIRNALHQRKSVDLHLPHDEIIAWRDQFNLPLNKRESPTSSETSA